MVFRRQAKPFVVVRFIARRVDQGYLIYFLNFIWREEAYNLMSALQPSYGVLLAPAEQYVCRLNREFGVGDIPVRL